MKDYTSEAIIGQQIAQMYGYAEKPEAKQYTSEDPTTTTRSLASTAPKGEAANFSVIVDPLRPPPEWEVQGEGTPIYQWFLMNDAETAGLIRAISVLPTRDQVWGDLQQKFNGLVPLSQIADEMKVAYERALQMHTAL